MSSVDQRTAEGNRWWTQMVKGRREHRWLNHLSREQQQDISDEPNWSGTAVGHYETTHSIKRQEVVIFRDLTPRTFPHFMAYFTVLFFNHCPTATKADGFRGKKHLVMLLFSFTEKLSSSFISVFCSSLWISDLLHPFISLVVPCLSESESRFCFIAETFFSCSLSEMVSLSSWDAYFSECGP